MYVHTYVYIRMYAMLQEWKFLCVGMLNSNGQLNVIIYLAVKTATHQVYQSYKTVLQATNCELRLSHVV